MKLERMKIIVTSQHLPAIFMLRQGQVPAGVTVEIPEVVERRGIGFETVATAILSFGSGVAASILANWLYEKLRDKPTTRITITTRRMISIAYRPQTEVVGGFRLPI